jgi:hypothetical protein
MERTMTGQVISFAEARKRLRPDPASHKLFEGLDPHDCGSAMLIAAQYGIDALIAVRKPGWGKES